MSTIVDLNSEVLIDRSHVLDPYLRLLLAAIGQELAHGSPWIAVDKTIASTYYPLLALIQAIQPAAA